MKNHLLGWSVLLLLANNCFAQPDTAAIVKAKWDKILTENKFTVIKNKHKIPENILKEIDVESLSEVTRYSFRYRGGCSGRDPNTKLNWAAVNNSNWIVCYTRGGYAVRTYYEFVSNDTLLNNYVYTDASERFKFSSFKKKYVSNTLIDYSKRSKY